MSTNKRAIKAAEEAIDELFSNTDVSQETTLRDLRSLRDEIDMKIGCIENDLRGTRRET